MSGGAVAGAESPPKDRAPIAGCNGIEEEHKLDKSPPQCDRKIAIEPSCFHPTVSQLPVAEHGIIGNMHSTQHVPNSLFCLFLFRNSQCSCWNGRQHRLFMFASF